MSAFEKNEKLSQSYWLCSGRMKGRLCVDVVLELTPVVIPLSITFFGNRMATQYSVYMLEEITKEVVLLSY